MSRNYTIPITKLNRQPFTYHILIIVTALENNIHFIISFNSGMNVIMCSV